MPYSSMLEITEKRKHHATHGFYSMPEVTLFTMSIGENETGMQGINGLQFQCAGRISRDDLSGNGLEFLLRQCFPADRRPNEDTEKPLRSFKCQWSLKARAIIMRHDKVLFDSSGESKGVIAEVTGTRQRERKISSVFLGRGFGLMMDLIAKRSKFDTLTVEAEVEIVAQFQNGELIVAHNLGPTGLHLLQLLRQNCSDVTIKCDSEDIKAHKIVLTTCSPVFARMLDSPMNESVTNVVEVHDFEPETVQDMVTFMYERTVKACSKESMVALLDCAEKYDISDLKVAVVKKMLASITPDSAPEFAAAMTTFQADEGSKEAIFDYIRANLSQLRANSLFRQFFKENVQFLL